MHLTLKPFARLAALGALGVAAGTLGIYALVAWASRSSATGGIDGTNAILTWISVAVPIAAIVAAHVAYARILWRYAQEP